MLTLDLLGFTSYFGTLLEQISNRTSRFFRKVEIPILGMVENMSGFQCPDCGKTYDIFGKGGARQKAEELNVPFLGGLPIDITLRTAGDEGKLAEVIQSHDASRAPFDAICKAVVRELAMRAANQPTKVSLPTL